MNTRLEVIQLASTIIFTRVWFLVWTLSSKGMFSLQPVYKFITFRGVLPIFIPAMWKLKVPPRIYFFLWLLSKELKCLLEKILARKNLDDTNCVFCTEKESVEHIFFECVVAKQLWQEIFDTIGFNCCQNFEYIGISMWLCNEILNFQYAYFRSFVGVCGKWETTSVFGL